MKVALSGVRGQTWLYAFSSVVGIVLGLTLGVYTSPFLLSYAAGQSYAQYNVDSDADNIEAVHQECGWLATSYPDKDSYLLGCTDQIEQMRKQDITIV